MMTETAARQWTISARWQEFEGEARANLIRLGAVGAFYVVELINYHQKVAGVDRRFHLTVTTIAVAWAVLGWAVHLCLGRRVFPERLKFLSTAADLLLLTCLLVLCDGPRSPLLVCYFIVISVAALRFDLALIRVATAGSVLGYGALLASARWLKPALMVPRYFELIFGIALVLCGVALGQIVRRARVLAEDYAARLGARTDA